jgi:hypothetical protein
MLCLLCRPGCSGAAHLDEAGGAGYLTARWGATPCNKIIRVLELDVPILKLTAPIFKTITCGIETNASTQRKKKTILPGDQ